MTDERVALREVQAALAERDAKLARVKAVRDKYEFGPYFGVDITNIVIDLDAALAAPQKDAP
jgi:hypothetical protein